MILLITFKLLDVTLVAFIFVIVEFVAVRLCAIFTDPRTPIPPSVCIEPVVGLVDPVVELTKMSPNADTLARRDPPVFHHSVKLFVCAPVTFP